MISSKYLGINQSYLYWSNDHDIPCRDDGYSMRVLKDSEESDKSDPQQYVSSG